MILTAEKHDLLGNKQKKDFTTKQELETQKKGKNRTYMRKEVATYDKRKYINSSILVANRKGSKLTQGPP